MTRSTLCGRSQLIYQVFLAHVPCAQLRRDGVGTSLIAKGGQTNKNPQQQNHLSIAKKQVPDSWLCFTCAVSAKVGVPGSGTVLQAPL